MPENGAPQNNENDPQDLEMNIDNMIDMIFEHRNHKWAVLSCIIIFSIAHCIILFGYESVFSTLFRHVITANAINAVISIPYFNLVGGRLNFLEFLFITWIYFCIAAMIWALAIALCIYMMTPIEMTTLSRRIGQSRSYLYGKSFKQ